MELEASVCIDRMYVALVNTSFIGPAFELKCVVKHTQRGCSVGIAHSMDTNIINKASLLQKHLQRANA